jgi:hypothetical protein
LPEQSDQKRPNAQLWRCEPLEAPGKRLLQRLAEEVLLLRAVQGHHPAREVDVPPAIAAPDGDHRAQRILERTAFSRRIDAGIRHRAGEIPGEDGTISSAHDGAGQRPKGSSFTCAIEAIVPSVRTHSEVSSDQTSASSCQGSIRVS